MKKSILFYLIVFALMVLIFIFFGKAHRQLIKLSELTSRHNNVYSSFQNLSRQINNAVFYNPERTSHNAGHVSLVTDSLSVISELDLLKSSASDSLNLEVIQDLDSIIRSELSWILQSNAPDSIGQHKSAMHVAALKRIDALITIGIERTDDLLRPLKIQIDETIGVFRICMILFILVSGALLLYIISDLLNQNFKRKAKETELETSYRSLENAERIGRTGNWKYNIKASKIFVSDEIYNILGVARNSFPLTVKSFLQFIHPEDRNIFVNEPASFFTKDKEFEIVHRINASDGSVKWVNQKGKSIYDKQGKAIAYEGTVQDITKQKVSEKTIVDNQRSFRALIENSTDGLAVIDEQLSVLGMSRSGRRILGYTANETIENNWPSRIHPADQKIFAEAFNNIVVDPVDNATLEYRYKMPDGSFKWLECSFNSILNQPNSHAVILNYHDISDRKKSAETIAESERNYRHLFEHNPLPMLIWDFETLKIFECNEEALKKYGYTMDECLQLTIKDLTVGDDISGINEALSAPDRHGEIHRKIYTHKKKNGEIMFLDISGHVVNYKGRRSVFVMLNDVTEKLNTEDEIKSSYLRLQELTAHLQRIREEERTRIAREIHDDLGQRLTGLKMDASWILKRVKAEDANVHTKLLGMVLLIDETVKTVRRISTELRPGILDDLGLIPAIEWQSEEFAKRTGIGSQCTILFNDFNPERNIASNVFRIYQEALTNIARHAQATKVETIIDHKDGFFILTIKDNGIGFNTDDAKYKKSWGLVGMKERVLIFRGDISIASEALKGTVITLKVPL